MVIDRANEFVSAVNHSWYFDSLSNSTRDDLKYLQGLIGKKSKLEDSVRQGREEDKAKELSKVAFCILYGSRLFSLTDHLSRQIENEKEQLLLFGKSYSMESEESISNSLSM